MENIAFAILQIWGKEIFYKKLVQPNNHKSLAVEHVTVALN